VAISESPDPALAVAASSEAHCWNGIIALSDPKPTIRRAQPGNQQPGAGVRGARRRCRSTEDSGARCGEAEVELTRFGRHLST
jgi:hypothetical protein